MASTTLTLSRADGFHRPSGIQRDNPALTVSYSDVTIPAGFSAGVPDIAVPAETIKGHERLLVVVTDQNVDVVFTRTGETAASKLASRTPIFAPGSGMNTQKFIISSAIANVFVRTHA